MNPSANDITSIIGNLAGSAAGMFVLLLIVLGFLTPLLIYLIHRSTSRTAKAAEITNNKLDRLIDAIGTNNSFDISAPERPAGFGEPIDTGQGPFVRVPGGQTL